MTEKEYYSVLIKAIENKMIDDFDKIIEEKVNSFRNNLRDIRDRSVADMIRNIRMISEIDHMGNVHISIEYKG